VTQSKRVTERNRMTERERERERERKDGLSIRERGWVTLWEQVF